MQLRNFTEEIVRQNVDDRLKAGDLCGCEKCRLDLMAIMLNRLPPKYYVTDVGGLHLKTGLFKAQYSIDLAVALTEAISIVSRTPQHDL